MKTTIQFLVILLGILSSAHAQTYTLDWGSSFAGGGLWPTYATSRNAPNIGGSGVNCSVNVTKSGGIFTTVLGPYGGPPTPTVASSTFIVPGSSSNLQLSLDFTTATQYCDVVFTFSQPVFNVSFNLADIDKLHNTLNYYYDKITVTGYIGTLSGGPKITKYDGATDPNFMIVSGNTAYVNPVIGTSGNTLSDATDQKGTIMVKFEGFYITSFRVRYENTAGTVADPTVQNIAIGNISFNKSVPLPVKLTSFDGLVDEDGRAKLTWNTSEEEGADFFGIERSENGRDFEEAGQVKVHGAGNPYIFTDPNSRGSKKYYRLKMVNADGTFSYSKIILISGLSTKEFKAYPTIVSNNLNLEFNSESPELYWVEIFNSAGQSVYRRNMSAIAGYNKTEISLPDNLSPGPYFVRLKNYKKAIRILRQ